MTIKNVTNFLATIVFATFLASCGSSIKEKTIKASNISISGEGSDYIKVVDGDYTLKVVDDKIVIAIKLELTKKYEGENPEMGNLSFIPLDKTGAAVPDIGLDMSPATMSDWDKIKDLLKGDAGKSATISFEWNYFSKKDVQARIMKDTENFEITRADFTGSTSEVSTEENSSNVDNDEVSDTGSEDYDKMLDDYDEYVTEYVKFYKKAMKGDNSAMAEYPAMMEKATKLQESMQQAQGNNQLSATQIGRMAKIQTKMLQAMQ
jgi:hypothetical protein